MVAEDALSNWYKAMDALGQVYMGEFRSDCAKYIVTHNAKFQLRLNEQQFLDLFLGGILKLDKLNMAWQTKSSPSRKPRLKGVFRGESMVSDTTNELVDCGLRKRLATSPTAIKPSSGSFRFYSRVLKIPLPPHCPEAAALEAAWCNSSCACRRRQLT